MDEIYKTEDGLAVRTIYIPDVSIHITNPILCSYFREFGAIERVQILPERRRFRDIIPPLGEPFALEPHSPKHFAYVTFVNGIGAAEALNRYAHKINDEPIQVEQAYSWHQPGAEDIVLPTPASICTDATNATREKLYNSIDSALNDDCISNIMSFLNIFQLIDMSKYSSRFGYLARQQRTIHILQNMAPKQLTMSHLRQILRLFGFGQSVMNLTMSFKAFSYMSASDTLYHKLVQYVGPQLRMLSLQSFSTQTSQFATLKPILLNLTHLDIDVNYEFDYEQFNDVWPKLETLRIHSSSCIHVVSRKSTKLTSFPKVTSLIVVSRYKLYEHLFENIVKNFPLVKKLIIINVEDYYTELPNTSQTDFSFTSEMKNLTILHLSCSQSYVNDKLWKTLSKMSSLKHLTLEITKSRSQDSRAALTDNNLSVLAKGMANMTELRLSGFAVTDDKALDILRYGTHLDSFSVYNCGLEISSKFIRDVVEVRHGQLSKRAGTSNSIEQPVPLHLITESATDLTEELKSQLEEDDVKPYLRLEVNSRRGSFNVSYGVGCVYRSIPRRPTRRVDRMRNGFYMFNL